MTNHKASMRQEIASGRILSDKSKLDTQGQKCVSLFITAYKMVIKYNFEMIQRKNSIIMLCDNALLF